MTSYCVIFGAAVRADGEPSGTLRRRVEGAIVSAGRRYPSRFVTTGGLGATGFVEAKVMRDLLVAAGVRDEDIIVEPNAKDTLESILFCSALLRDADDVEIVVPCTSRYHLPRCALLLRLMGWKVEIDFMPSDFGQVSFWRLFAFYLKEFVALPYDVAMLSLRRSGTRSV